MQEKLFREIPNDSKIWLFLKRAAENTGMVTKSGKVAFPKRNVNATTMENVSSSL